MRLMWCISPKQNAEFGSHMEDVLKVYSRPYDESRPVICMDEKPFQLLDDRIEQIPMSKDNYTGKYDCEYVRKGSCSIFMLTEPLGQWREAHALPRRTSEDWTYALASGCDLLRRCEYDSRQNGYAKAEHCSEMASEHFESDRIITEKRVYDEKRIAISLC